ncbi:MAG: M28 family peptidase [Bacteroidetes bacterium]|nr:M28 family peptidase [Bacteroidota bacterium]
MKIRTVIFLLLISAGSSLSAQNFDPAAVEKIERTLSSDAMQGRATFTPGIEKAADYIGTQFRQAGLKTLDGGSSYRQPFTMLATKPVSASAIIDGQTLSADHVVVVSASPQIKIDDHSGFEKAYIRAGAAFGPEVLRYIKAKKNTLVLVDSSFARSFPRLARFTRQQFKSDNTIVFLLTSADPATYSITAEQEVTERTLANVVGILPGNSKKNEYVIFSGHYDHLGIGKPDDKGDSIYNGANDDASGTTAVIMLARYFAKKKNNARTLVFATFTAEEIGEFGSEYFSNQFDPSKVMAMFNIEMIGTESKWGTNSAYITGYERTDMGKILEKNLKGSGFSFHPDPYPRENLFYRSDNATLAKQGVPAHTISTSKMDSEKYYHTAGDEMSTLDMKNMAAIIRSIAISSKSIVDGKDTPSRVDTQQLR